jgi:hypothetical protein
MTRRKRFAAIIASFGTILLAIVIFTTSCTRTVTRRELDDIVQRTQGNSFPGELLYCGSGEKYDYYVVRVPIGPRDDYYRVERAKNDQPDRMPLTSNKSGWRNLTSARDGAIRAALLPSTNPATTNPNK